MSKVLTREDCNNDFWKEKFLSGFPPLFAERVRTEIRSKHNGNIPYSQYTYGELGAEVVSEGLALCNDLKLKKQLKKDKTLGKMTLGDFCEQFGFDPTGKSYKKKKKKSLIRPNILNSRPTFIKSSRSQAKKETKPDY